MRSADALRIDWEGNRGNVKAKVITTLFRCTEVFAKRKRRDVLWWCGVPLMVAYRLVVEWVLGVELPAKTKVGPGLVIYHGQGLVVRDTAIIGRHVVLRHNTTIGIRIERDGSESDAPIIGNRVDIGAHAVVIGPIRIGDDAVVGAGAVVVSDVPNGAIVVGNPARRIHGESE